MTETLRQNTAPRIFFDEPVAMVMQGSDVILRARALNLSSGGIYLCSREPLTEGSVAELLFYLPDGQPIRASATVIRTVRPEVPSDPTGMALRFDALEPECAQLLELFVARRLEPATGEPIRLRLGDVAFPITARTQAYFGNFVSVEAELPFLRLGSPVTVEALTEGQEGGAGAIRWVSVHVPPDSGIPRLNIGIELSSLESDLRPEEEADPVCSLEFVLHSQSMDQKIRADRRAAAG